MPDINLINPFNNQPLKIIGDSLIDKDGNLFSYKNGAYRFVQDDNYTENFGYQWNKFVTTQIDKAASIDMSQLRFFAETNWNKEDLTGKNVLEVGSGAGRFSQIFLDHTKEIFYSVYYSNAVEANYKNNGPNQRLHLFQASIYEMPFEKNSFDKVFCIGVLQHTPDVKKSVRSLIDMAKPGAEVVVDFYPINGWWTKIHAKYILRPFTKKMDHQKLFNKIDKNADRLIKAYRFFKKIGLGKFGIRFLPVCDIDGTLPKNLSKEKLREMVVLDTFDMFSPEYDQPQRISTIENWFNEYGMKDVWGGTIVEGVFRAAVVKGVKK
jgi:ubiquinone/menaquinone biosynthesis C-methylase UbiE